ncbi:hypothetical protein ABPG74_020844 [Tetrahymena malaccensis]
MQKTLQFLKMKKITQIYILQQQEKQSNRQTRAPSTAQPRPLTLQEEIQKIGRLKNQDHALVEQEEETSQIRPPVPPQNNAPFRMSVRDALTQSLVGDPMAASSQDQNNNSQTKQVNKALPVPSALFSQAGFINNLMNDEDDEEEKQRPNNRHRSTRFTFNNLFNIEKPQFGQIFINLKQIFFVNLVKKQQMKTTKLNQTKTKVTKVMSLL